MNNQRIQEIKKDIYRNCYEKRPLAYVAIQSLIEHIGKDYLRKNTYQSNDDLLNAFQILQQILNNNSNSKMKSILFELNRKANEQKHGESVVEYDLQFIKNVFSNFNYFVSEYFPDKQSILLDFECLEPNIPVIKSIPTRKEEKLSNRTLQKDKPIFKDIIYNIAVGAQGKSFILKNIVSNNQTSQCDNCVYAVIYNFLQRSSNAKPNKYIKDYEKRIGKKINFEHVFRYQILILNLIRFYYPTDKTISVNLLQGDNAEFQLALDNINHYASMINLLTKATTDLVEIIIDINGIAISYGANEQSQISIEETNTIGSSKDFWFAPNIIYSADIIKHKNILLELFEDFFGFKSFRPGQLECLVSMLNTDDRGICILPTGWGKSVVYYFNALLLPCRTIIISPTEILIKDQCRNLFDEHGIDDVLHISFDTNINNLEINNKIIYMTPATMQRRDLVIKLINLNVTYQISNVVLDEVHTICNWSHDFRPDYLMLAHNIFSYIDNCRLLAFTATANYKVLNDITHQLKIDANNIFAPITFKPDRYRYEFVKCESESEQFNVLLNKITSFANNKELVDDKMIVFTKNKEESKKLWDNLAENNNYDTACFDDEHTYSYIEFITEAKHVLIADTEMGIGLNFPNIKYAVHYGLPISKAQYVQEIGRASRDERKAEVITIFKPKKHLSNDELKLINLNTSIDEIIAILQNNEMQSDLLNTFKLLLGNVENYTTASQNIMELFNIIQNQMSYQVITFKRENSNRIQKYLYMLRVIGVVNNWYIRDIENDMISFQIETEDQSDSLEYIKKSAIKYLNIMGNFPRYIYQIQKESNISGVIFLFQEWFYNEFLYYHREQLINVIEFFNHYSENLDLQEISQELENYFSISLLNVTQNKDFLQNLTLEEILSMNSENLKTLSYAAEELLASTYDPKIDLLIYLYQFKIKKDAQIGRLLRSFNALSHNDSRMLLQEVSSFYDDLPIEDRIDLFNAMSDKFSIVDIVDIIYSKCPKDYIYYGVMSKTISQKLMEVLYV